MKSIATSIDAPIGGWNTFDSLDNMPPDAAIILDNLIPSAGTVDTRGGTIPYADTFTGQPVETVASLDTNNTSRLVVASAGCILLARSIAADGRRSTSGDWQSMVWRRRTKV